MVQVLKLDAMDSLDYKKELQFITLGNRAVGEFFCPDGSELRHFFEKGSWKPMTFLTMFFWPF